MSAMAASSLMRPANHCSVASLKMVRPTAKPLTIGAFAVGIHGADDPMFPFDHARALAREIPGAELLAVEHMGHEYFPRATWDLVVPAILRHTSGRR